MPAYVGLENWPKVEVNFDKYGSPMEVVSVVDGERTKLFDKVGVVEVSAFIKAGELPRTVIVFDALPVLNYYEGEEDD